MRKGFMRPRPYRMSRFELRMRRYNIFLRNKLRREGNKEVQ